jgi:SAM-dependent methyltransferase
MAAEVAGEFMANITNDIFFRPQDFQEYMTSRDCPYCHDSTHFKKVSINPRVVKCVVCGLYRLYPRMNRDGQVAMLQRWNDEEIDAAKMDNPLLYIPGYVEQLKPLKKFFPSVFQGGKVLDVGCQYGLFPAALRDAGADPIGIEPNDKYVAYGRQYGLDLRVGRFEQGALDLEEHSLDLITFCDSLYYMPDLRETFELIHRYLKPSGGLYIVCHVATSIYYSVNHNYISRYGYYVEGIPTLKALAYILNTEGFKIHRMSYENFCRPVDINFLLTKTSWYPRLSSTLRKNIQQIQFPSIPSRYSKAFLVRAFRYGKYRTRKTISSTLGNVVHVPSDRFFKYIGRADRIFIYANKIEKGER